MPHQSILIYGMGMMGASLGLALKRLPAFHGSVTGVVRSEKSARFIEEHSLADHVKIVANQDEIKSFPFSSYDLTVIGLPVYSTISLLDLIPLNADTLITDMSSTREDVFAAAEKRKDLRFVGSHPMCGSEDAGPSAAVADLYHQRLCIIFPGQGKAKKGDRDQVRDFWSLLGMNTMDMDAKEHDQVLSYLSHAPHIISGLLTLWADRASVVKDATGRAPMPITGGGFRDMARIAGSNPEMWTDILMTNQSNLAQSMREYKKDLESIIEKIEAGDREWWMQWFYDARKARNHLSGYPEDR